MSEMICTVTREALSAHALGEGTPEERHRLDEHLRRCPSCQTIVTEFEVLGSLCRKASPPPLSPTASLRLLAGIRAALGEGSTSLPDHDVLTLEEVAAYLRIEGEDLVSELPGMPTFEIAGRVRIRRDRLLAWIEERERQARSRRLLSVVSES